MYKTHISRWGFDKKNKGHEIMAIVRKRTQRSRAGKATTFYLRDRLVDLNEVDRYLRRKGMPFEDAIRQSTSTPPALRCSTPEPILAAPSTPPVFERSEKIFLNIRNYIFDAVENGTWFVDRGHHCHSTKPRRRSGPVAPLNDLCGWYDTASHLFLQGNNREAGLLLVKGSSLIADVLREEHPGTLTRMIDRLLGFRKHGWHDLSHIILRQFSNMASELLPELHPLRQIFAHLTLIDPDLLVDVTVKAWHSSVDVLEQALGVYSPTALSCRLTYIRDVETVNNCENAELHLRGMAAHFREQRGMFSKCYGMVCEKIAEVCSLQGRFADSMAWTEEVIHCARSTHRFNFNAWARGMRDLARCHHEIGDNVSAEAVLRCVVDAESIKWGWQDAMTISDLAMLGDWLTEWGRTVEANEIAQKVSETVRQSSVII